MKAWLALLTLVCTPAWAYIPPSQFIVHTMIKKHTGYKTVTVKSQVSAMNNGQPVPDVSFKDTTVFYFATGTLRSRATDAKGDVLFEQERRVSDLPINPLLLFDANAARVIAGLKGKGVPVQTDADFPNAAPNGADVRDRMAAEKTSLVRWNGSLAWALGDRGDNTPQLWVEKDTFIPVRLMFTDSGDKVDLLYDRYRQTRAFFYPWTITWEKADKQPILRADVAELGIDQPDTEFAGKRRITTEGMTDAGKSAPSAVQDLIKSYYSVLR